MMHFVHAIFYQKPTSECQKISVCEKVFSIKGEDDERLDALADAVIEKFSTNKKTNASWIFAGVRKIIMMADKGIDFPEYLVGIQITESFFEVDSIEKIKILSEGKMVEITYRI